MPAPVLTAAAAIRYCRERACLSARALSNKANLGDSYVSRVEAGAMQPSLRAFAGMVIALGMTDREIALVIRHEAQILADERAGEQEEDLP